MNREQVGPTSPRGRLPTCEPTKVHQIDSRRAFIQSQNESFQNGGAKPRIARFVALAE